MVLLFFYDKLTNIDLIKKINEYFEIVDGYILINNYDKINKILEISNKSLENNVVLRGIIVNFDMKIEDVLLKINDIPECRYNNRIKYTMEIILTTNSNGGVCKTYVIY